MDICKQFVVKFESDSREEQAQILLFINWICACTCCTRIWKYLPLQKVDRFFLIVLYEETDL